jgi:dihydropteroate synthase
MVDNYKYRFGKTVYDLSARTHIMGILNVTPDSFSDGGKFMKVEDALAHARKLVSDGADFIDVGGQSTRPGSREISVEEELNRIIPVVKGLREEISIPISVDTYRAEVAEEALKNGANIINDISAFNFDPKMSKIVAKYKASCILMHIKGRPENMQKDPQYDDLVSEILLYFEKAFWKANVEGISQIIVDPGFGFGKNEDHNLMLIKKIFEFKKLDCPVMIGVSRKSSIGKILNSEPDDWLEGTIALNSIAIMNGVNILRVHDVKENLKVAKIVDAYKKIK